MCALCPKYGYSVVDKVLIKKARYETNHLYIKKAWAFSKQVIDTHAAEVTTIRVVETDLGRTWEVTLADFLEKRERRFDTDHEPQYFLRDAHWRVSDPNMPAPAAPTPSPQLSLF